MCLQKETFFFFFFFFFLDQSLRREEGYNLHLSRKIEQHSNLKLNTEAGEDEAEEKQKLNQIK